MKNRKFTSKMFKSLFKVLKKLISSIFSTHLLRNYVVYRREKNSNLQNKFVAILHM